MDLTFQTENGVFNYRVCAVILHNNRLLAMKNSFSPYYYLPGGRVTLHETAEQAILREIREELHIEPKILRPLWLNQGFFTEDVTGIRFHEICLYYLVDVSETDLLSKGHHFTLSSAKNDEAFTWLPLSSLDEQYLYPLFIKREIFNLPDQLTILAEYEP